MSNRSDDGSGAPRDESPGRDLPSRPRDGEILDLADVFSLLGDPGRLRLLLALRGGEVGVRELSEVSGQSESAVSHALQLLRAHRIVAVRREGRRAFYRLDDPHVRTLLDVALRHTGHSDMQHPERPSPGAPPSAGPAPASPRLATTSHAVEDEVSR
ncbi:ArsR/SmtB family transcription factor [Brachybacterium sp. AOP43-C2-M15]|uniref:ArsR/SmtB family transcription factor n=1 Tax=Brachybacterium sp. AOP43-C2-M15 TaxID=3457661 RepID=UPI0040340CBA